MTESQLKLYHYTSLYHLQQILTDGEIKTSPSNLLKPVNPRIVNGCLCDETDIYKPVVWLTSVFDFNQAEKVGLSGSIFDKTEVAIQITTTLQGFYKWEKWAQQNQIDKNWFAALKKTAPGWKDFYVAESPIKIDDNCNIIFRPDIMEKLTLS